MLKGFPICDVTKPLVEMMHVQAADATISSTGAFSGATRKEDEFQVVVEAISMLQAVVSGTDLEKVLLDLVRGVDLLRWWHCRRRRSWSYAIASSSLESQLLIRPEQHD